MNSKGKRRVLIAMSGGVDSSVSALLATRRGYDCTGITMKLFPDANETESARRAAEKLKVEHLIVDFSNEFKKLVMDPFVSSYERGETPNPCIECNKYIKFGSLYEYARKKGFDVLVTGHYARIEEWPHGIYRLMRARDTTKDQSYFLYSLRAEELEHIWFPLGGLTKKEVREIADEAGLENAGAPESQDICFVSNNGHAEFIEKYRSAPLTAGNFVDTEGHILGRHKGIERYTIGQRKGLGIALGHPVFVKEIRPDTAEVVISGEEEVFASGVEITDIIWNRPAFSNEELKKMNDVSLKAEAVIRYKAKPVRGSIGWAGDVNVRIDFDEPVRAPAKGQTAVIYDGDLVLGGGKITMIRGKTI